MAYKDHIRRIARRLVKVAVWALAAFVVVFALSWALIEPVDEKAAREYPGGVVLRDAAGKVLRVSLGKDDTDCRPYYEARADDWIVKALVASEDRLYWRHPGVNPWSVARALRLNVFGGRRISGASTITMQAVRLISPHPKSYWWKFLESFKAMKLERDHDKLWIVTQYLNRAPFGSNLVGIEAAANGWFGKGAHDLSIGEAALLAGIVQRPTRFRPDRHLDDALKRREYVLGRMLELGYITDEQLKVATAAKPVLCRAPRPFREPYFCDWAMRHVRRSGGGGDFVTTLDADIQKAASDAVNRSAEENGWCSAAVVMRVSDGAVVALACSGDYFSREAGQVNTALAPRPAGSTLKPFIAALAMDRGILSPDERLRDVPLAYRGYNPQNFDASFRGTVSLRDSLVLSLNMPFVQLLGRIGLHDFGDTLRALGCANMSGSDDSYGLGMAIGNAEVTLVELVAAYGTLARGGAYMNPAALARETAGTDGDRGASRIFSQGAAYIVSDMLSGGERSQASLGHAADVQVSRFAWKTGTSAAYRDAWTVAWNPEWVVGVWCGHKQGGFGDTGIVGAEAAAPVAMGLARSLYPQNDGPWFVCPQNEVERCEICVDSGMKAGPDCPARRPGRALRGRGASAVCTKHRSGSGGASEAKDDSFVAAVKGKAKKAERLVISSPADGASIALVGDNTAMQKVVCKVIGNPPESRLWWFVDGAAKGETVGSQPFAFVPAPGRHSVSCSTADGVTASVRITVTEEE